MKTQNRAMLRRLTIGILFGALTTAVTGAPVTYNVDPNHTYPAFEADHMGGFSVWRGKVNSTMGTIVLDKEAETGTVEITIDMTSLDMGHDRMNEHAMSDEMLDVQKFPNATYSGTLVKFVDGNPTAVDGTLTLHGVTQPVNLELNSFRCMIHPRSEMEVCGADASGTFNRDDFDVDYGKTGGFLMYINLLISIEAHIAE